MKEISPRFARNRRVLEGGVTLVELMIAMTLGLVLTAGVIQVFIGNRTTYALNEGLAWIQENARFTLDYMANHTRMAGYMGCLSNVQVFNNLAGPPNNFMVDLTNGIQGHEFVGTSAGQAYPAAATNPLPLGNANAWSPALPPELANPARVIPGSDVVVIRYVASNGQSLVSPFSDSSQLFVAPPDDFIEGEILVVTDCQKASIFQLTQPQLAGGKINLVHSNNNTFVPGNVSPTWGTQQSYGLGSEVARLQAFAFYVGRGQSDAPSLFQLRLQPLSLTTTAFQAEELIEGVDTLQVRYGLDTDNDRQVDVWQSANLVSAANNWARVVSAELSVLMRSPEEYGTDVDTVNDYEVGGLSFDPVDDRRLRKVFTTTVGLRNRLP
jgi:type IV pilus assembly protein PilW